ncbi:MAG: hypothetical protein IIC75_00330 [Bacteroidetes bacterium]|nr:hypothetical protein [Bacteroidota bacterium]
MMITEELLPIKEIETYPTTIKNVHESAAYQSYHILKHVKIMIERGDSDATILGFIIHFQEKPIMTHTP